MIIIFRAYPICSPVHRQHTNLIEPAVNFTRRTIVTLRHQDVARVVVLGQRNACCIFTVKNAINIHAQRHPWFVHCCHKRPLVSRQFRRICTYDSISINCDVKVNPAIRIQPDNPSPCATASLFANNSSRNRIILRVNPCRQRHFACQL